MFSQTCSFCYGFLVSATVSRPYNQPALRHSVSATLSRPHNQPALRHSVSATLSRPHNQPALRHSVSAILSRPHNQPALRTLCQCHPLNTIQSAGVMYTLSVPPSQHHTISRRYDTLSVPSSQDHTISRRYVHSVSAILSRPYNQPALRTLCHCHPLKTIRSAGVTYTLSVPPSQDHTISRRYDTLSVPSSQDHTISRRYVHSVIAILSRPYNQPALRTL